MKEIVLDTETTGISIKEGHRIVEIGCIELDNLIPTQRKFHSYLNPERRVSEKALEIHGYADNFLSEQKKFKEVVESILGCPIGLPKELADCAAEPILSKDMTVNFADLRSYLLA